MNWSDLLQWEGSPLSQKAQEYEQQAQAVTNASEDLSSRANGLSGSGQTVTAVQQALRKSVEDMRKQAEALHSLASLSESAAAGAHDVGAAARALDREAADKSIKIRADGSLDYVGSKGKSVTDAIKMASDMGSVSDRVSAIKVAADELVEDTQKNIAAVEAGGQPQSTERAGTRIDRMKLPPKGASPDEVAKWWSSLTDAEKAEMVKRHPREIGKMDGVEGTWRDKANRKNLEEDLAAEQEKLKKFDKATNGGARMTPAETVQRNTILKRIEAMNNIKKTLDRENQDGVNRQLLCYDASHADVRAAVAQGDVDTAQHIGVLVPGMNSNVAGNLHEYDDVATRIRQGAEKHSNGQSVATVTYMNYRAPQTIPEVTQSSYADEGAKGLSGFLNGLDASREHGAGDAHITPIGHSYGSTTLGKALTQVNDGVVDDFVMAGSPGAGVQDVSEMHVPKGHAYVGAAPYMWDVVQGSGPDSSFGKNPDTMPGFKHISGFTLGATNPLPPLYLHSSYFNAGSKPLDDMASIVGGKEPE